ncbi:rRNA methyltransferase Rrp8 [Schizosaccharomyces cryophilus OY26]|uniref:Ribosomal RNA-processing protein 8 n=1 Tax=Schizosaccharomyces cryophilus (strain OY26 / ATCC MYA-4695 / CBS 11777 / NBRC 106824 / NRRL Y48691) TaxID=653667 RepID=S9VXD4_SCHCR|nr:rRNA methyltransferase Rrp8 [Schizosaccharomyces cryophilus OY26]EPY50819.1 rRNA methyltransferase Rrp8 [Schizosaccharomyces cryophilus OY26]
MTDRNSHDRQKIQLFYDIMFQVNWDLGSAPSKKQEPKENKKRRNQPEKTKPVPVKNKDPKGQEPSKKKQKQERKGNETTGDEKKQPSLVHEGEKKLANEGPLTALQKKMKGKLDGAKFRWINERLYTTESEEAVKLFQDSPDMFDVYHAGFRHQIESWPENPVDVFIRFLKERYDKKRRPVSVVDLGCGEAKIAETYEASKYIQVQSFDLVSANKFIVASDISDLPLEDASVDIAIFCLSLMGTNWQSFLREAHRVLKPNTGQLWVAEIKSRFSDKSGKIFAEELPKLGFENTSLVLGNKMFTLFEFVKQPLRQEPQTLPPILNACIYKRR